MEKKSANPKPEYVRIQLWNLDMCHDIRYGRNFTIGLILLAVDLFCALLIKILGE